MMVETEPALGYDDISGEYPGHLSIVPGEITIKTDLDLNDRNQRRRFRRKYRDIFDMARQSGKDLLAYTQPDKKIMLLIGIGVAAGGAIGARILYKHRQQHKK